MPSLPRPRAPSAELPVFRRALRRCLDSILIFLAGALLPISAARAADDETIRSAAGEREDKPAEALWLRLRGGYARGDAARERLFGVLELGLGLDRLFGGDERGLAAAAREERRLERAFQRDSAPGTMTALAEATPEQRCEGAGCVQPTPDSSRPAPVPARAGPASSGLPGASAEITPALARAVLEAALRVGEGSTPEARLESLAARSRSSASLPEVRFAAGTSRDQSLKYEPTVADPARYTQDGGRDLWFETRLTWHLDRALFSHDEIAIERLRAQERETRRHTTHQVIDALVEWQRARRKQRSELTSDEEREAAALRELEATLRLDALTDGWFSRHLARSSDAATPAQLAPERAP
ncbi:MAG TPA: hypothetical protein VG963_30390 [Polyangiaceae bacterium]|nr:hypothetical protein [Polyangiaceae bacterium]